MRKLVLYLICLPFFLDGEVSVSINPNDFNDLAVFNILNTIYFFAMDPTRKGSMLLSVAFPGAYMQHKSAYIH